VATEAVASIARVSEIDLEGEVLAEEDAEAGEATAPVRPLPVSYAEPGALALRAEVRTAAIAAAGGVLAGAATVAAVRAVSAVGSRASGPRRRGLRRQRPPSIVASRSFIVDVHLLGR
jgi:hypothetical protein